MVCVCVFTTVCVHFGWVKCRAQTPSMDHYTWSYVTSRHVKYTNSYLINCQYSLSHLTQQNEGRHALFKLKTCIGIDGLTSMEPFYCIKGTLWKKKGLKSGFFAVML